MMIRVRLYHYDDSVDIEIPESEYIKLLYFVNRREYMSIHKVWQRERQ